MNNYKSFVNSRIHTEGHHSIGFRILCCHMERSDPMWQEKGSTFLSQVATTWIKMEGRVKDESSILF
jgi:hypothetical protein